MGNEFKTIKELKLAGYTDERVRGYQMAKRNVLVLIDKRIAELRDYIEKGKHPTAKEKRKFNNILYHKCCELVELKERINGDSQNHDNGK